MKSILTVLCLSVLSFSIFAESTRFRSYSCHEFPGTELCSDMDHLATTLVPCEGKGCLESYNRQIVAIQLMVERFNWDFDKITPFTESMGLKAKTLSSGVCQMLSIVSHIELAQIISIYYWDALNMLHEIQLRGSVLSPHYCVFL